MKKTITFDPDVAAAITHLQAAHHIGVSKAVNDLVRRGLAGGTDRQRFAQETSAMGAPALPLDDIAATVEALEGAASP